jgi:hypothetical protein
VADVVIKRCPYCPSIGSQAEGIVKNLASDLNVSARIEDGEQGELSVFVDGVPVIQRTGDDLPNTEEVEAAVQNAIPTGV